MINSCAGFTFSYHINDNLQLTAGYMSTVQDSSGLRMDNFSVSLVYGWHKMMEGMKRLKDAEP